MADQIEEAKEKSKNKNIFGWIVVGLQLIISGVFMAGVLALDLLPAKYVLAIGAVLLVFMVFVALSQRFKSGRVVGKVISILIMLVLVVGSAYLWKTHTVMDELTTEQQYMVTDLSVVVMANSSATGLQDLDGKSLGIQTLADMTKVEETLADLKSKYTKGLITVEYVAFMEQVKALYDGKVDAILINEAFRDMIVEAYPNFDAETKVLDAFVYKEVVVQKEEKKDEKPKDEEKIAQETFSIYISGNDSSGEVSLAGGRTDVNIIATVNPETRQILLTTTPRDYYVYQPVYSSSRDKLTHAGIWGIDCSMETLENLYDIDIDYYVRVNFSGFQEIVNALDGVNVYSQYAFSTAHGGGYYFEQGMNHVDGSGALAFVRERYAFADGDAQRGRNQMAMVQAILDKAMSPAILTNYLDLLSSLSSCFITDVPRSTITNIVKNQLDEGGSWNIVSYTVAGYTGGEYCPALGDYASIMYENEEAIETAKELMQAVMDGKTIAEPAAK